MQNTAANENMKIRDNRVTEVELVYRNKMKASERAEIRTSSEAYHAFLKTWDMGKIELQEQFRILLLDRRHSCIGIGTLSTGGISECPVDLRLAFAMALKSRATSLIIAHNHPSGNIEPSEADKELTAKFCAAGRILDLRVLDHLIITSEGYTSLSDQGFCR